MRNGFSLVELLMATALTLTVTAGVVGVIGPARAAFSAQPEIAVVQQRLRVAAETIFDHLVMAGAGRLDASFAPVLPFRRGAVNDAAPAQYRTDTITLYYAPSVAAETTLAAALAPGGTVLEIATDADCPQLVSPCGFAAGTDALIYDDTGHFERFTVVAVNGSPAQLAVNRPPNAERTFPAGSTVVQVIDRTYFLKSDTTGSYQLMQYDGSTNADLPVVDHVVGLTFEYFGDPRPPESRIGIDPTRPWTTYGLLPPPIDVEVAAYPAGENCVFRVDFDSGQQVSRLPVLGDGTGAPVPLTAADLTDGPWCPDAASRNRWDADLLRIRKIAVTIRVEAAMEALRGPASVLFAHAGSARRAQVWVPDQEIRFQVSPRNLNRHR